MVIVGHASTRDPSTSTSTRSLARTSHFHPPRPSLISTRLTQPSLHHSPASQRRIHRESLQEPKPRNPQKYPPFPRHTQPAKSCPHLALADKRRATQRKSAIARSVEGRNGANLSLISSFRHIPSQFPAMPPRKSDQRKSDVSVARLAPKDQDPQAQTAAAVPSTPNTAPKSTAAASKTPSSSTPAAAPPAGDGQDAPVSEKKDGKEKEKDKDKDKDKDATAIEVSKVYKITSSASFYCRKTWCVNP